MFRKDIYKMSMKILQLCQVLFLSFKELVEFSFAAQSLKLQLQTTPLLKQIFQQYLLLRLKQQKQNFLI